LRLVRQYRVVRREQDMTITDYVVALGGMLGSLGAVGILAAGVIRAKARH
jgi:hypothetical protein